jgi:predicted alpha/beta superfamily hydrolase
LIDHLLCGGFTRLSVNGKVGCMSPSFWWNNGGFIKSVLPKNPLKNKARIFIFDCGAIDREPAQLAPLTTTTLPIMNELHL